MRGSRARFQSTHPLRGATAADDLFLRFAKFQSTHPLRGATYPPINEIDRVLYFNPRTPCGVRQQLYIFCQHLLNFNPRTPCGVRPVLVGVGLLIGRISIHAPLAGCDGYAADNYRVGVISIHAPLAGCDTAPRAIRLLRLYFNPRTPCGVRLMPRVTCTTVSDFNPRTPCGVRRLFT